jgi:hypothetical protein
MRNTLNPTPDVFCKYGAPMGRRSDNPASVDGEKLFLRYVPFVDGCYDRGGAYWGMPANLYWWSDLEGTRQGYLRAPDHESAKAKIREDAPACTFY